MQIKNAFTVNAPPQEVWAFLLNIPRVSACMPGAEAVEEVEPDVYQGKLKAKVGVVRANFSGKANVEERVEPELLSARFKAEDRALASHVTGSFTTRLIPVETGTKIDYEIDLAMRGRLATMGFTVMQQTAKKMTNDFANCLQAALAESTSTED